MKQMRIVGGNDLTGTVKISGAKNSAVALIPAALLSSGSVKIKNIPNISDIDALIDILNYLNIEVDAADETLIINSSKLINKEIPLELSNKLRASYYFMGALLGRCKKVSIYFPGGCPIGKRPINLHLKGFEALGARVIEKDNLYIIEANELKGNKIHLDVASVGATINIMLAAVYAKGKTVIENAAKEPEIVNVAALLNSMGAKVSGAGSDTITITGVENLTDGLVKVIPDRIEAGTYIILGSLLGNKLKVENIIIKHLEALILKLKEMEIPMDIKDDYIVISKNDNAKSIDIKTSPYPGFPTDLQQPLTTLLTSCNGISTLEETIYENRFQNIKYLNEMGASIKVDGNKLFINAPTDLNGKIVKATDLRAGACLILAGLKARGITIIEDIEHVLRGYEKIDEKLIDIGAKIEISDYN